MGRKQRAPAYNFHNDTTLHDQTPDTLPFGLRDVVPGATLMYTHFFNKSRETSVVKEQIPKLPLNDPLSQKMTQGVVSKLWGSMMHPACSYKGDQYQYRTADGSNNNILWPNLGKAGEPYSKTVQPKYASQGARPDPGDLFDLLMARNETTESKTGINSLLLYQATIVIHDIFRTDDEDANKSCTSSYLDLAPLYGSSKEQQERVRTMQKGFLKPDTFHEDRLTSQPPGVCIFLIMYNRFHNYVAQQILEINENGRFSLPPGLKAIEDALTRLEESTKSSKAADKQEYEGKHEEEIKRLKIALQKQDNDLFQTARLITCGMYAQIAVHDYLRCLMRMHEKDTPWTLDPRMSYPEGTDHRGLQRGEGNMVSCEFNLLYRFHPPLSERDAKWSEEAFVGLLSHMPKYVYEDDHPEAKNITEEDIAAGRKITVSRVKAGDVPVPKFNEMLTWLKKTLKSPQKIAEREGPCWPEGLDRVGAKPGRFRFERDPTTHMFDTAQLAAEMIRCIEDPILSFGARHIPKVFKQIEILGILQARKWEVAGLNEFREYFGMSRHKSFEDINFDPSIQNALRDLYEDPDQVELYPGIFCEGDSRNCDPEEPMPNNSSSALWRGIFSDAVTLVRSDRFYTIDWNVQSLTSWGMNEVASNPKEQGYIDQLDLSGLELIDRKTNKQIKFDGSNIKGINFRKLAAMKDDAPTVALRRKLVKNPSKDELWRGSELAVSITVPAVVSGYADVYQKILSATTSLDWVNPDVLQLRDIPAGSLRDVMTHKWRDWSKVLQIINRTLQKNGASNMDVKFMSYFSLLAKSIREREERSFQYIRGQEPGKNGRKKEDTEGKENKHKVKQLDLVKDFAIPLVTRFTADFLGFWWNIKTEFNASAKFDENQIYQHLENCQNYDAYGADPAKTWERRQAYQKSIKKLQELAEQGVRYSQAGVFGDFLAPYTRTYGADPEHVKDVRRIGVQIVQALQKARYNTELIAAIMLATALRTANKVIMAITEIVAFFVDPTEHLASADKALASRLLGELQNLAFKNNAASDKEITKYVVEAQRLTHKQKLVRVYKPARKGTPSGVTSVNSEKISATVKEGETVLVDLAAANHDEDIFTEPKSFKLDRQADFVMSGASSNMPSFSQHISLIALTSMLKHIATLKNLRVAHDKLGRLKKVTTPEGHERYCSAQWNVLLLTPATWNLRYENIGRGVYTASDNANQGHGINQIWQIGSDFKPVVESAQEEAQPVKTSAPVTTNSHTKTYDTVKSTNNLTQVTISEVHNY